MIQTATHPTSRVQEFWYTQCIKQYQPLLNLVMLFCNETWFKREEDLLITCRCTSQNVDRVETVFAGEHQNICNHQGFLDFRAMMNQEKSGAMWSVTHLKPKGRLMRRKRSPNVYSDQPVHPLTDDVIHCRPACKLEACQLDQTCNDLKLDAKLALIKLHTWEVDIVEKLAGSELGRRITRSFSSIRRITTIWMWIALQRHPIFLLQHCIIKF